MDVKIKKDDRKFKPFKLEISFKTEEEALDLRGLLYATSFEVVCNYSSDSTPVYSSLDPLREALDKQLNR